MMLFCDGVGAVVGAVVAAAAAAAADAMSDKRTEAVTGEKGSDERQTICAHD